MIRAATDLSDGGLALAGFEMAEAAGCGLTLEDGDTGWFFGEDQARYLLAVPASDAAAFVEQAKISGIAARLVGSFGGDRFKMGTVDASLADLTALYRSSFAAAVE